MKVKTLLSFLLAVTIIISNLISCGPYFGQVIISKPDEYMHTYEAGEKVILRATAIVFKDKSMGSNVKIDQENKTIETDYIIQGEWRTKSMAKVKKINWKESELTISVITEKKTETGWEMRRLLDKEQYTSLFDTIDLKIYEEMSKIE
jgi:hypothetical protein